VLFLFALRLQRSRARASAAAPKQAATIEGRARRPPRTVRESRERARLNTPELAKETT
jgi:hypothetical protein